MADLDLLKANTILVDANVGIGTTSPTSRLHVMDTFAVEGPQPKIRIKETDTTNNDKELLVSGGSFYIRQLNDDNTNGSNLLVLDSSGNITVVGTLNGSTWSHTGTSFWKNTQQTDRTLRFGTFSDDTASYFGPLNDAGSDELIDLGTSDGRWRNLNIAGNASIGGSAYLGGSLTIGSSGQYVAGSLYSDANWGMIFRAKTDNPNSADFLWADSTDAHLMVIKDGKVGIGKTPIAGTTLLDVYGGINLRDGYNITWGGDYTSNYPTIFASDAGQYIELANQGAGSQTRVRINATGVGIRDTAPATALTVGGDISIRPNPGGDNFGTLRWFRGNTGTTTFAKIGFRDPTLINDTFLLDSGGNGNPMGFLTNQDPFYFWTDGTATGTAGIRMEIAGGMVINENGADSDFRVESAGHTHALFVDASDNTVRIGRSNNNLDTLGCAFGTAGWGTIRGTITNNEIFTFDNYNGSGFYQVDFRWNNVEVGSISVTSAGATYNTTSDRRLKDNIVTITDGKEKLLAMNPVTHTWIADPDAPAVHGFIAQEMQEVVPEAVTGEADGEDMMSMDYGRITPVIVAALQDALKEIEELKTRISQLEAK